MLLAIKILSIEMLDEPWCTMVHCLEEKVTFFFNKIRETSFLYTTLLEQLTFN